MTKMKELYGKVAGDSTLQAKFHEIMSNAEKAGEAATGEKLINFAKEAGYDITLDEMKAFFGELRESGKSDLSEAELDMVAGGKSKVNGGTIIVSVMSLGVGCGLMSLEYKIKEDRCENFFYI